MSQHTTALPHLPAHLGGRSSRQSRPLTCALGLQRGGATQAALPAPGPSAQDGPEASSCPAGAASGLGSQLWLRGGPGTTEDWATHLGLPLSVTARACALTPPWSVSHREITRTVSGDERCQLGYCDKQRRAAAWSRVNGDVLSADMRKQRSKSSCAREGGSLSTEC